MTVLYNLSCHRLQKSEKKIKLRGYIKILNELKIN